MSPDVPAITSLRSYKRRPAFLQMQAGDHGNTNPPLIIDYVCNRLTKKEVAPTHRQKSHGS